MSLHTASLNSGSNGNCYYIGNEQEAVLVDVGISCRETERRMERIGLDMQLVKAIFISHEHSDHIAGVRVLSKKYSLPVYITAETLKNSRLHLHASLVKTFVAHEPVCIGGLSVLPFPKHHDASEPHSFIITGGHTTIGVLTDIGSACEHVLNYFKQCHAVYLEANYDDKMLENGNYPFHLKKRISGDKGHLSNAQALEIFTSHRPEFMSHVFLSHLSRDNNHPELAKKLFTAHAGNTQIFVASRDCETEVFSISSADDAGFLGKMVQSVEKVSQMSLF